MASFEIRECVDYDDFVREWHADELDSHGVSLNEAREQGLLSEAETTLLWELLGQLEDEELLIRIPDWLAEEKVGYTAGGVPTGFVGRVVRETQKAILFDDSVAARELMKLAHRLHRLEHSRPTVNGEGEDHDQEREEWLERRRSALQDRFTDREEMTGLAEAWLPKSQIQHAVRRVD